MIYIGILKRSSMKGTLLFLLFLLLLLLTPSFAAANDPATIIQEAAKRGDVKLCDQLELAVKDGCILAVAVAKRDISLCDTMGYIGKMGGQDSTCKAAITLDTKYCDDISISEAKTMCRKIVEENKKRGGMPAVPSPANAGPSAAPEAKAGCARDAECGDNVCSKGRCIEPKMTLLFVPFFWKGTNEEFDKTVDGSMGILLNALPLKDCKSQVKVLKLHMTCSMPDYPKNKFYLALYDIKKCAERYTTSYDYVVGLTNRWDSFFGIAGGIAILGFPVTLATASAPYIPAHEIGHSLGLNEEYCAGGLNKLLGKCGFSIKKNPLKSEYGCREKDSPYDADKFSDCCTSDGYLKDACAGNVGISESKLAEDIYNAGVYDIIDELLKNAGVIDGNLESCASNAQAKARLNGALNDMKNSIDRFYEVQKSVNFELGSEKRQLSDMHEYFVSECLAQSDLCGCIEKNSGYFKGLYSHWLDVDNAPSYPRAFESLIRFNTRNIMAGPATLDTRSGPFEFSKPAYDYLSTLPQMQCSMETPVQTPSAAPSATVTQPAENEEVVIKGATLPSGRYGLSCVENSATKRVYCLGGLPRSGSSVVDQIVEYVPITDGITTKNAKLPAGTARFSCAPNSVTNRVYCFGGFDRGKGVITDRILEYDPEKDEVKIKTAKLPTRLFLHSCAENSKTNRIYCFGGLSYDSEWHSVLMYQIFEYNPENDDIKIKKAKLPDGASGLACAESSDTHKIYCFGGFESVDSTGEGGYHSQILEYDSEADRITRKRARLPAARTELSCAYDSATGKFYCFGGERGGNRINQIIGYDPVNDIVTTQNPTLPIGRSELSCVESSDTHKIYCFGGWLGNDSDTDQIIEYSPKFVSKVGDIANNKREASAETPYEIQKLSEPLDAPSLCGRMLGSAGVTKNECLAIINNSPDGCTTDGCYAALAARSGDAKLCERVVDDPKKGISKAECLALAKRGITDCEKAYDKGKCSTSVALLANDPALCTLGTEERKKYCIAMVSGNTELCKGAGDKEAYCYLRTAVSKKDTGACKSARDYCARSGASDCDKQEQWCKDAANGEVVVCGQDSSKACATASALSILANGYMYELGTLPTSYMTNSSIGRDAMYFMGALIKSGAFPIGYLLPV